MLKRPDGNSEEEEDNEDDDDDDDDNEPLLSSGEEVMRRPENGEQRRLAAEDAADVFNARIAPLPLLLTAPTSRFISVFKCLLKRYARTHVLVLCVLLQQLLAACSLLRVKEASRACVLWRKTMVDNNTAGLG